LLLLFSHLLGGQVDVGLDQELGQQDRFLCASHRYLLIIMLTRYSDGYMMLTI
jgi:hypothetical protein